jgi:hypothetical protein
MHTRFWWENKKERTTRMTDVGERIILKWITLSQTRDQWRGLEITVMKLWVP